MKKLLLLLALITFLAGCERIVVTSEYQCNKDTLEQRASFTLDCIKNANPMSDEDPEDWIAVCEETSIRTYCEKVKGFFTWGLSPTGFKACSEAKTKEEIKACR